jgi:hypothetical protein
MEPEERYELFEFMLLQVTIHDSAFAQLGMIEGNW